MKNKKHPLLIDDRYANISSITIIVFVLIVAICKCIEKWS
jgi:hypothetical protein